jgi:hypothetical protein
MSLTAFRHLWSEDNTSIFRVTRESLMRILTYHQVMPAFLDFMLTFSTSDEVRDTRFSAFYEETALLDPKPSCVMEDLERSGRRFQMCYNLKGCVFKDSINAVQKEWTIRPASIHHQFDVAHGTSLWIVAKPGADRDLHKLFTEQSLPWKCSEDSTFETVEGSFRASLSTHLIFCLWARRDWSRYFHWMETKIEQFVSLQA